MCDSQVLRAVLSNEEMLRPYFCDSRQSADHHFGGSGARRKELEGRSVVTWILLNVIFRLEWNS